MAVELDPQLLEILACPSPDHAPLRAGTPTDPSADALTCTSCGRIYPIRDGIPVLLLDEAITDGSKEAGTDGVDEDATSTSAGSASDGPRAGGEQTAG